MAAFDYSSSFSGINNALSNLGRQNDTRWLREAQADIGTSLQNGDYNSAAQKAFGYGDSATGLGLLKLGEQAKDRSADANLVQGIFGGGVPSQSLAGIGKVSVMQPNEVQDQFLGGVKQAGLTNPVGLAAVAATGQAESSFAPQNVNRAWSDPSQSGQPGQAGGVMSWRADRLQNLQRFAQSRGEQGNGSPATQAAFLAQEDPTLVPRLNAAKSPEEAAGIMAQAWRFAGYDKPGGEAANRIALTRQYADKFGSAGQPVQVAQAATQPGAPMSDAPAAGANEAQFYVPGTDAAVPQSLANNPRIQNLSRALAAARGESAKAAIKQRLDLEVADLKQAQARANAQVRPLTDQAERAARGIGADDTAPYQIDANGRVTAVGGAKTVVNIDQKAEQAYAGANGKAISDRFSKIVEEGDAASQEAGTLARIRELGGQIQNIGKGAALQSWLAERGVKVGPNVSEIEAYGALIDKLTPQQRIAGAGATSDYDARMFKNSLPGLMRTPGGNEMILSTLEALNTYRRQRGDLVAEAMANNEKPAEVIKKLRELPDPFGAFKEARKGGGSTQTAPEAPYAPAMPEGARQAPDGKFYVPDPARPGTLAQKREARAQAIDAIRNGLGTAEVLALGQRLTTRNPGDAAPERPAPRPAVPSQPQATPQRPAAGTPRTATNPNTGERIMLTPDGQWVPYS